MRQLSLSVIIPAYNEVDTIGLCLESLKQQTDLPLEILVVDDGSTDGTGQAVKQLAQSYQRVRLLSQPHLGPAKARNLAANQAKGEVLVFVDADMEFSPDFLVVLTKPIFLSQARGTWSGEEWVKNWTNVWARCWNFNQGRKTASMVGNRGQKRVFRAVLTSEFLRVKGFDSIGYTDDWTLVSKLGYQPKATRAKFYHHNPDLLKDVFSQAYWIGKRQYKLSSLGIIVTLVKYNPGFSLISGLFKSLFFAEPRFIVFKLVHDWGIWRGAWDKLTKGNRY
ncbi:MAG: glycosyltransferase family 2 protein [Patescibacteria group bacterium]|nr:glycosyltransferase family 2 protein [Patescibacteria group bacterium]